MHILLQSDDDDDDGSLCLIENSGHLLWTVASNASITEIPVIRGTVFILFLFCFILFFKFILATYKVAAIGKSNWLSFLFLVVAQDSAPV